MISQAANMICVAIVLGVFGYANSLAGGVPRESGAPSPTHITVLPNLVPSLVLKCSWGSDESEEDRRRLAERLKRLNLVDRPGVLLGGCASGHVLQYDDLLTAIDGAPISAVKELNAALTQKVGKTIVLTVLRVPTTGLQFPKTVQVTLTLPKAASYKIRSYAPATDEVMAVWKQRTSRYVSSKDGSSDPIMTVKGRIYVSLYHDGNMEDTAGRDPDIRRIVHRLYDVTSGRVVSDIAMDLDACIATTISGNRCSSYAKEAVEMIALGGDQIGNLYPVYRHWHGTVLMYKIPSTGGTASPAGRPAELVGKLSEPGRGDKASYLHDYWVLITTESEQTLYDIRTGARIGRFAKGDKGVLAQLPESHTIISIVQKINLENCPMHDEPERRG